MNLLSIGSTKRITLFTESYTGKMIPTALHILQFVMSSAMKENFGDVKAVRFNNAGGVRISMSYKDNKFIETHFYFTDPEVFEVFSFNLLERDNSKRLSDPFTAVVTPTVASRYFGNENPIGKSLTIDWDGTFYDLTISGIMESPPFNSHLQFEILISNSTAEKLFTPKSFFTDWTSNFCYNYLLIPQEREAVVELALQMNMPNLFLPNSKVILQDYNH